MSEIKENKENKENKDYKKLENRIRYLIELGEKIGIFNREAFFGFGTILALNKFFKDKTNKNNPKSEVSLLLNDIKTIKSLRLVSAKILDKLVSLDTGEIQRTKKSLEDQIKYLESTLETKQETLENDLPALEYTNRELYERKVSLIFVMSFQNVDPSSESVRDVFGNVIKQFQENLDEWINLNQKNILMDIDQRTVLNGIKTYLILKEKIYEEEINILKEKYIKSGENKEDAEKKARLELGDVYKNSNYVEFVESFSKGHCNGLSILWSLAMLKNEEETFTEDLKKIVLFSESSESMKENMIRNEMRLLPPKKMYKERRFSNFMDGIINDIVWFQRELTKIWASQDQVDRAYQVVGGKKKLNEDFNFGYLFTENEFSESLRRTLKPKQIFYIGSENHTIGIFCREYEGVKIYYAYNPNNPKGYLEFNNIPELASFIKTSFFNSEMSKDEIKSEYMPLVFKVFSFENGKRVYQNESSMALFKELLSKDKNALKRIGGFKNQTLIRFLIREGCIEQVQELLNGRTFKINEPLLYSGKRSYPLEEAIDVCNFDMILFLLRNGAFLEDNTNPYMVGWSALDQFIRKLFVINEGDSYLAHFKKNNLRDFLEYAVDSKNLVLIELLSRLGYDPTISKTLLMTAFEKLDREIYSLLLTNPKLNKNDPDIVEGLKKAQAALKVERKIQTPKVEVKETKGDIKPPSSVLLSTQKNIPYEENVIKPFDIIKAVNDLWKESDKDKSGKEIKKLLMKLPKDSKITAVRGQDIQLNGKNWRKISEFYEEKGKMDNPEEYKRHKDQNPK